MLTRAQVSNKCTIVCTIPGHENWSNHAMIVSGKVCQSTSVDDTSEGICHKLIVDKTNRHFPFSPKTKGVINPQNSLRVIESDILESSTSSKLYSVVNERLISILENGIVQGLDGHYMKCHFLWSQRGCVCLSIASWL